MIPKNNQYEKKVNWGPLKKLSEFWSVGNGVKIFSVGNVAKEELFLPFELCLFYFLLLTELYFSLSSLSAAATH